MAATETDVDALESAYGAADESFSDTPVGGATAPCPDRKTPGNKGKYLGCPECFYVGALADRGNRAEFIKDFKALQKEWPKLTPTQRRDKLVAIGNKQATKTGSPPAKPLNGDLKGNSGEFDSKDWTLAIDDKALNDNSLDDAKAQDLADTVYHESRHNEQNYLIAKDLASQGKTPKEIADMMPGMNADVIKQASDDAKKNPIPKESLRHKCADRMFQSKWGKDSVARDKTINDLAVTQKNEDDALKKYKEVDADPKSTEKDKKAALENLKKAHEAKQKNREDYLNLPMEADAWHQASDYLPEQWNEK